ncbi:MAG TPA: DNA primase [Gammaproteobacteria bacterium]|nr:DNA primase [Gammaproteobacteria bacterium]
MSGRIPTAFIDELLARVDIVDVIDSRVQLKKTGREYQACCPFHNEKTPSFTVSPDKQFYHCFGCGAHGSALGFLMEYEHLGFVEAVEELAAGAGMEVPREAGHAPQEQGHQALYAVMEQASQFYRQQLKQHPQAARARDYLKGRGLTGEVAAAFELGFAPPGWDNLGAYLLKQGATEAQLVQAGLVVKKDNGGHYDRFRERIMFPIRDRRGRVVAFGGRLLGKDEGPKYLNSAETPIFHKGRELYGLYQARKAERKLERLLVVEGYMDVVALAQFGVRNAVATLGTATTREHLERLFRVVPQIVFCFDGDRAGRQAAWRALENALPILGEGRELRFMFLPEGEDPDSLVRKEDKVGFEARVTAAQSFSDYFFGELCQAVDMGSIDGRARLVERTRPLLEKLPEGVFRHMMATRLAEIAKVDPAALGGLITRGRHRTQPPRRPVTVKGAPSTMRQAIQLLLHRPQLVACIDDWSLLQGLEQPGAALLLELVELLQQRPQLSCGAIVEHWRTQEKLQEAGHLAKLASQPLMLPDNGLETEFVAVVAKLAALRDEQRWEHLQSKVQLGTATEAEKHEYSVLSASGQRR